jgi:hypothetical protein
MRAFPASDIGADLGGENTPSGYVTPAGLAEIAPGVTGLFIWLRIDDQRQRSFVTA